MQVAADVILVAIFGALVGCGTWFYIVPVLKGWLARWRHR